MVPLPEIVDIGPVRHEEAVPAQLFLHPAGEQQGVGVRGDAVDGGGIHHGGECACPEAFQERSEVLLPEVVFGNVGRRTVLSAQRDAIAHEMLDGHGDVLPVNVVRVFPLQGEGFLAGHFGLEIGVFPEAFPLARPARVPSQVHHRGKDPGDLRRTGFVSHRAAHHPGIFPVESGAQVDFLRVQRAFHQIGCPVDHVHAIDTGDADGFHGFFLDLAHHGGGFLAAVGAVVHHVEDGAHLVLADDAVQLGRVYGLVGIVLQHGNVQLHQLSGLLFEGHAREDFVDTGFKGGVCRNDRLHLGSPLTAGKGKDRQKGDRK